MLGQSKGHYDEKKKGQKINLDEYIHLNLHLEKTFYVIEKEFWDVWCDAAKNKFQLRNENKKSIDNRKLLQNDHEMRLKEDKLFGEDLVIAPKYVFKPLSTWYDCNKIIKRKVHQTKTYQNIMRQNRHKT